jgi:hypothetical protein
MRAFELIERLINSDHATIMVHDLTGHLVEPKVTVTPTPDGIRLVIEPATNSITKRAADPLSLNAYQDYAYAEAIYPERGKGTTASISLVLAGLLGESGKAMHSWFDTMRGGKPLTQDTKDELVTALAHSFWYVAALAQELGVPLSQIGAQSIRQARAWRRATELAERQGDLRPQSTRMAAAGDS